MKLVDALDEDDDVQVVFSNADIPDDVSGKAERLMAIHRFQPHQFHGTLGAHAPVLRVADGDTVITTTVDAHGFDHDTVKRGGDTNPDDWAVLCGRCEAGGRTRRQHQAHPHEPPHGLDAARPCLECRRPGAGAARCRSASGRSGRSRTMQKCARLEKATEPLKGWTVPLKPMLGCFGVAPADGEFISTATSGQHGGNMDYNRFGEGATVYFPVAVEGALFCLGDAHAAQGDGEIAGTGIETSAEVEFTVAVKKGPVINWPRGEDADSIFTVGNARPLEQALQHATSEMLDWLAQDFGLDAVSASHLLGMHVRYDVANVFNPAFSVACRLDKQVLAAFPRRV